MTQLLGMTWDHPRGYDPLAACSAVWRARTGVAITWERRSLQDFESYPVEDLARRYDLIVIDHPHVGLVARKRSLLPFNGPEPSVIGPSLDSYRWEGRLWAQPIDAATQVAAWRPDMLAAAPAGWDEVLDLAQQGRVLVPLRPPHALMAFYTLAANAGTPCATEPGELIAPAAGVAVLTRLRDLVRHLDAACFDMDPIAVLERMARPEAREACAPLIYGYVSYARPGFRPRRIAFADLPLPGAAGSTLGGTGIAVSAHTRAPEAAIAAARWFASEEAQRGPYAAAGGQPAHRAAWYDAALDAAAGGFFSATRRTLERAWVRPRGPGYMAFQDWASARVSAALRDGALAEAVAALNAAFAATARA
jgi:multiple sugar transport system substrate-binding protein